MRYRCFHVTGQGLPRDFVNTEVIRIEKKEEEQVVIGHAGFIKSAEDLYEAMINSVPGVRFGLAFAEASGPRLIRSEGNDDAMIKSAESNMQRIGAGHTFIIIFSAAYPINVINSLKQVNEVARIFCATANAVEVIVAETNSSRAIIGVADGMPPTGIEDDEGRSKRRKFLRDIGYKK